MTPQEFAPQADFFLRYILQAMVDSPEQVHVDIMFGEQTICFTIDCAQSDLGKIIGKKGANIMAIRTLFQSVAGKYKQRCVICVKEDKKK